VNKEVIMHKLAPSLLAADFTNLGLQLQQIEQAGAHYLHFDVMDGHFVPNISFGIPVLKSIRPCTKLFFDVHLMIIKPERYVDDFAKSGADSITIHFEAFQNDADLLSCLKKIRSLDVEVGLAISPTTPVDSIFKYLKHLNLVLIMSVEPGFGGQKFMSDALKKAESLAKQNANIDIQMDGGIDLSNLQSVLDAGVNVVVAGSSIFGSANIGESVRSFLK